MNNLEKACILSCERWFESFPNDIPKHEFSIKHQKTMKKLFDKMRGDKYHKLTRNAINIILVASIIFSIVTTVFAIPTSREYLIKKFTSHSVYSVTSTTNIYDIENISIEYIPEGFIKSDAFHQTDLIQYTFTNNNYWFNVSKISIDTEINFDTEENDHKEVVIEGITYIIQKPSNSTFGIIFNNGKYEYYVNGNINESELLTIAQSIS